ncbi:MAG TPA: hypothetical protein VMG12_26735 [Polyangiaceae bacterium]|nr:hypothetical protein [Polyangiaceae bacterium]
MPALDSTALNPSHAPLASRDDWRSSSVDDLSAHLGSSRNPPEHLLPVLARAWTNAALAAHAAVAAYARFALQLMNLGAPPQLLHGCSQAMQDEVAHAQACFSLARRYAGHDVGPGPLPAAELAPDGDLTSVVLEVVQRGCIREAVGALCAREALEHCQDAATREVLVRHQAAKAQQAQLAWRFVAWALRAAGRELPDHVRVAFLTALSPEPSPGLLGERERTLLRYGVLSEPQRTALMQRILREVVLPCMEALLARSDAPRASME